MAKMFKKKYETPIGELEYVMVTGKGKLKLSGDETNPLDYEYQANLKLGDNPELKAQIEADIEEFWQKAREAEGIKKKKPDWTPIKYSKDDEGEIIPESASFNAKTVANWKDKQSGEVRNQTIAIYDGRGTNIRNKLLEKNLFIGNGSTGIIYCQLALTENADTKTYGVTAYLEAVQLAKFVPYKSGEVDKNRLKVLDGAEDIDLDAMEAVEETEATQTPAEQVEAAPDVEV